MAPNTVQTYVGRSETFLRWLAGRYRPTGPRNTAVDVAAPPLPGRRLLTEFRDSLSAEALGGYLHDYAVLTAYDRSLKLLRSACADGVDLGDPVHRDAVLRWLRTWGCRHLRLVDIGRTSSGLLSWWRRYGDALPGIANELSELGDEQINAVGPAYSALASMPAAGRSASREVTVSFGSTAAAKTLFAIRPRAFPPWDDSIRAAFGFGAADGQAFTTYLALVADTLRGVATRVGVPISELPAVLKRRDSPPPKLVDEYLWVRLSRSL
jgi:hypothetical protein